MSGGTNVASPDGAVQSGASLWIRPLQVVLLTHSLALLAQPAIAGEFLSGTDGVVQFHEWTGWLILALCIAQIALAAVTREAPLWLVMGSVMVLLGELMQVGTGYMRYMPVHVPLGVILFGVVLAQTVWMFRRAGISQ